ncbi:MAG: hypothetical protein KF760_03445 [Candidatus Eremiobacteraeota bacterium]|nr:hypothetical protein [Candidatus Eremiobacteraeota bacterium]MCW5871949.1 hypothetical protein [Candidatus Eremiobacteraeota bacterium]
MNESGFGLRGEPAYLLLPRPPLQAFYELDVWLLEQPDVWPHRGLSRSLQNQLFPLLENLRWSQRADWIRNYSLESLAAGLLCGALDGLFLYRLKEAPLASESLRLRQALEVADGEWRQLDADALQLQAGYGKYLNRATEEENVEFLARPGSGDAQTQRAMAETFRTGYSLGLIDAAIVTLHGQTPDRLQ